MLSNRSNLPLCQVLMFNTSPISTKCNITVRTCKLLWHIPLEEIDWNCLEFSYTLFFRLIHISLTFSEKDVRTALSYSDKNHFEASISRKSNFKTSIWKWQRYHFQKLLSSWRHDGQDHPDNQTTKFTTRSDIIRDADHNTDVQSVFKVVRKCESKNWFSCGADGQLATVGVRWHKDQISRMGRFP